VAFLLAQLGAHATERFAERIAALDLSPAQAGLLRAVAREPGRSQQAVAEQLGVQPSRFVALVDELEQRGAVERRRNATDRRLYALHLTAQGELLMRDVGQAGQAHENDICAALSPADRATLRELLQRVADQQGLTPGVHPGYRR
jgi:DNA-binding MarR family transcriptional regulator